MRYPAATAIIIYVAIAWVYGSIAIARSVSPAGMDRNISMVRSQFIHKFGCLPDPLKGCTIAHSELETVFIFDKPKKNAILSVETMINTDHLSKNNVKIPNMIKIIRYLLPDDGELVGFVKSAILKTKSNDCVYFIRKGRYEIDIKRNEFVDRDGMFAFIIIRKDALPKRYEMSRGEPKWLMSKRCEAA